MEHAVIKALFAPLKSQPPYLQEFKSMEQCKIEPFEFLDYYNYRKIKEK